MHEGEPKRGHRNQATLAVAGKLVAYLMAVDKSGKPFQVRAGAEEEVSKDQRQWVDARRLPDTRREALWMTHAPPLSESRSRVRTWGFIVPLPCAARESRGEGCPRTSSPA
jgi:hypothetical protein